MTTHIRELNGRAELDGAFDLFDSIWHFAPTNPPITAEILQALVKAGGYAAGAFDGERLIGACVGFFGPPAEAELYSYIAGVAPEHRGVGHALKLHQRSWALAHGARTVAWTYDPLISRNAYFNVAKLGAEPVEYLPNFYGSMNDAINGSDDSDRLLIRWDLNAPHVEAAAAGTPRRVDALAVPGAVVALDRSADGLPIVTRYSAETVLVAVPQDVESLRVEDPDAAKAWRLAVRDVLGPLLGAGARVTGFDRNGWYVVQGGTS
jgi:predicted GNAT superfamily acetyltransferase